MDTKAGFYKSIYKYFYDIAGDKIPDELLRGLSDKINDYYFEQYNRFAIQYPKSLKRYSSFQVKDLEHPTTFEIIIKFFKDKLGKDYSHYTETVLKMNTLELKAFEKSREDFYKMF